MYAFLEAFRAAMSSLMAHRMRSFLTTLGILIGTGSVIAVVSLVQGFSESIKSQFADVGGSTMTLQAVNDNENYRTGKLNNITFDDIDTLRYHVPGVGAVAPILAVQTAGASYKGRTASPQLIATTSEFQQTRSNFPEIGRFIVESDNKGRRRVAVIGAQ
ncbi:MAG: ABC transporter permease, partial [Methylococcales bacterium]